MRRGKLAGIHSAMPAAVARRRLPGRGLPDADFPAYREASAQVMEVLRRNAETVEVVGLDEAYLDLTGLFSPKATMRRIAARSASETGLTCSVGISESRLLAKITSELGKPAGLVVLSREEALERFAGDSAGLVPGIGPKTVERLEAMGIAHPGRAARGATRASWKAPSGRARAPGCTPAAGSGTRRRSRVARETKSQSARDHLRRRRQPSAASSRPRSTELAEELCRRLRQARARGRTIGIKVRLDDWTNVTRSHTVEEPTNDPAWSAPLALELLRAYDPQRPVRLLGVRVASLRGRSRGRAGAEPQAEQLQLADLRRLTAVSL